MRWKIIAALSLAICFTNYAYAKYDPTNHTLLTKQVGSLVHDIDRVITNKGNSSDISALNKTSSKNVENSKKTGTNDSQHQQSKAENHTVQSSDIKSQSVANAQNANAQTQKQPVVGQNTSSTQSKNQLNRPVLIHVNAQSQNPELYNGCEMTSLSMLLDAAGQPVDKMTLANEVAKDPAPETLNSDGSIAAWGDPNRGFVGDITGSNVGYGVYHGPVYQLLNQILPGKAVDLTGDSFDQILNQVAFGKPVVAWTTVNFAPSSSWQTWQGPNGPVHATFDEHVVLIVGFNNNQIFINDPLDGTAAKAVDRAQFEASWQQLGQQAISYN